MIAQRRKVRVNAVAPLAHTRMTNSLSLYSAGADRAGGVVVHEPEDLAPLFGYLLADCSAALTGQILRFNGRELSMINHPVIGATCHSREHWDIDDLRTVIEGEMQDTLSPVGLGATTCAWPPVNPAVQ